MLKFTNCRNKTRLLHLSYFHSKPFYVSIWCWNIHPKVCLPNDNHLKKFKRLLWACFRGVLRYFGFYPHQPFKTSWNNCERIAYADSFQFIFLAHSHYVDWHLAECHVISYILLFNPRKGSCIYIFIFIYTHLCLNCFIDCYEMK